MVFLQKQSLLFFHCSGSSGMFLMNQNNEDSVTAHEWETIKHLPSGYVSVHYRQF